MGKRIKYIVANNAAEIVAYSENKIIVSSADAWDYAIPENYTNFHDGFLYMTVQIQRGDPILNYKGEILYFHRELSYSLIPKEYRSVLLVFDRHGKKYAFCTLQDDDVPDSGNPSYFRFLPRVRKYAPSLQTKLTEYFERKEKQETLDSFTPA